MSASSIDWYISENCSLTQIPCSKGAANNAINQGVNILAGEQQKFDWKAVVIAAIATPLAVKLNQVTVGTQQGIGASLARSAIGGMVTQGAGIAVHGEGKFDWTSLAADSVGSAVGNSIAPQQMPTAFDNFGRLEAIDAERAATPEPVASDLPNAASARWTPVAGDAATSRGVADGNSARKYLTLAEMQERLDQDPFSVTRRDLSAPIESSMSPTPGSERWRDIKDTPYVGATLRTGIGLGGSYVAGAKEIGSLLSDGYNYLTGNSRSIVTGDFSADSGLVNGIQSRGWGQTGADMLHGFASAPTEFFSGVMRGDYERAGAGLGFYATLGMGAVGTEARVAGTLGRTENGLRTSAVVSAERAEAFLVKNGISPEMASSYVNSFDGPITARLVRPGEDFLRYTDSPNSTGSFLTKTEFPSSSAAVRELHLEAYGNNATYAQAVTSSGRTIVLEGAVNNGANGVRQTFTTNRGAFTFGQGKTYP